MRAAVRRSASARPAWRSTATIWRRVAHQRGQVRRLAAGRGAQVEDALAGLRVHARADGHRRARLGHEQALLPLGRGERVERRRRARARRAAVAGARGTPGAASSAAVVRSVLARSDGLGGPVAGRHQRAGRGRRRARPTTAARSSPGGSAAARPARASRRAARRPAPAPRGAARRSTALTSPAPRGASALASSTDSPTAACGGHAVQVGELEEPEPQRGAAPAGRAWPRARPASRVDQVVERRLALHGAVGELRRERPLARVQPQPARLAGSARSAQAPCSNTRRIDRVRARARGGDARASRHRIGFVRWSVSAPAFTRGSSL